MTRRAHAWTTRLAILAATLATLSACATTTTEGGIEVGTQATIEGEVVSVDTTPWAFDGNAVVTVASATAGTVRVQLPARWNLCKAPAPEVQALKPHDRVQAIGTVSAPGELVVCEQPEHRLRKLD